MQNKFLSYSRACVCVYVLKALAACKRYAVRQYRTTAEDNMKEKVGKRQISYLGKYRMCLVRILNGCEIGE